jgi:hypothetical protein
MTTNTGGPAFAVAELANIKWEGMTLRDYFAAKAMQTYMISEIWNPDTYKSAARSAYKVADAMLEAREA